MKKRVTFLVPMFPSRVMVFILSKTEYLLQFCADLDKKSKFVKTVYMYPSERSRYALS